MQPPHLLKCSCERWKMCAEFLSCCDCAVKHNDDEREKSLSSSCWWGNSQLGLHMSCPHVPLHMNLVAFYCILCWLTSLVVNWCFSVKSLSFGSVFPVIALFIFRQFLCGFLQYMKVLWVIKRSNSLKSSVPSPIWPRFPALLAEDVWTFRCNGGFFLK